MSGLDNKSFDPGEDEMHFRKLEVYPYEISQTNSPNLSISNGEYLTENTIQVLPSESNYRRLSQIHLEDRPTIDELMKGRRDSNLIGQDIITNVKQSEEALKMGWINGVLIRVLLSIWGVMLFLRLSWVMGQSGLIQGLVVITVCNLITITTTLSMSSVATNGRIASGGVYYMISRALGPAFGGAIGVLFAIGNSIFIAMTTLGFCLSLTDFLKDIDEEYDGILPGSTREDDLNDKRLIGAITLVALFTLAIVGMKWITRVQKVLVIVLIFAQLDMLAGTFLTGGSVFLNNEKRHARGYTGWSIDTLKNNINSEYVEFEDEMQSFLTIFGVFFNSVTGIVAGANMSGDLRDPSEAIPKGTLTGIFTTYATYMIFGVLICFNFLRAASGNPEEFLKEQYPDLPDIGNCTIEANLVREQSDFLTYKDCTMFGSAHDQQVMTYISATGYLVYFGCFGATLSSALAGIEGAPRVLQAVGKDKIYPYISFFGKGHGPNDEPFRAYGFAFVVAFSCLMIAELNTIGYLTTNFTLAAYALMNFSAFHSSMSASPGWRPAFKFYNPWISLIGAFACVAVMIVVNWILGVGTLVGVVLLYGFTVYIKPDANWGSSLDAQAYVNALNSVIQLTEKKEHVKTYRPQVLLMTGNPAHRQPLVDFANLITKRSSLLICANIETDLDREEDKETKEVINSWLDDHDIKAFYTSAKNKTFSDGVENVINLTGLGKLAPNLMMIGYHQMKFNPGKTFDYYESLLTAFEANLAVGVLRLPGGIDFSSSIHSEEQTKDKHNPFVLRDNQGNVLSKALVDEIQIFSSAPKAGTIDIWWIFDDGGLTLLLPHLIKTKKQFAECKLRVFALTDNVVGMDEDKRHLVNLLEKFRIDIVDVIMIPDITAQPTEKTIAEFDSIIHEYPDHSTSQSVINANKQKTNRHLRTAELLREHSMTAELVVVTLPMPRRQNLTAVYYMAWLEIITRQMPPILLIRGNQTSVLTFYS